MSLFQWPDVRVGDVFYVTGDPQSPTPEDWEKIYLSPWYQKIPNRFPELSTRLVLSDTYNSHSATHKDEPRWIKEVGEKIQAQLRQEWLTSEYFEPLALVLRFYPGLDFCFGVQSSGLIHEVAIALGVFRLENIRQLSFLTHPRRAGTSPSPERSLGFNHSRYLHSLVVMATASLIGRQVGLSQYDLIHLQVAGLTHDVLTPAGGDTIKDIDPETFNEDIHYSELFIDNKKWESVREKYDLNEELLAEIIRGEGILGRILDIADKTSYVAHDCDAYLESRSGEESADHGISLLYDMLRSLGDRACALWDCVRLRGSDIVITDAKRLAGFLKLRAMMFRYLYYDLSARSYGHFLTTVIVESLYQSGEITKEALLKMNDNDLDAFLDRVTGQRNLRMVVSYQNDAAAKTEAFPHKEGALERMRDLHRENPEQLFLLEVIPDYVEKSFSWLTEDATGEVGPFAEVCLEETEEILALGRDPNPVKLYSIPVKSVAPIIPSALLEKILVRQHEQFGLE